MPLVARRCHTSNDQLCDDSTMLLNVLPRQFEPLNVA
jgi:hypothetical protein